MKGLFQTLLFKGYARPIFSASTTIKVTRILQICSKGENENIQFIIVTNSSALIDKAAAEELFMLIPSQQLAEGYNQLVKVSDANLCVMPS